ncbi:DUF5979 domain-containing protein, partial [Rhodococcus sp. IEGM 1379]|uniref:DUF5979 domain-containing protein n=1 Tax=Rhodococcus sp. IEGM 1379 TaxID=3047086 RepID=UPI0024B7C62F
MRNYVFPRRAGEGVVSRWAALGMIVAVMALVMSSFLFAQVSSADEIGTSATPTPTQTVEVSPSTEEQDSTPAASTSKTPAASTTEKPTSEKSTTTTTTPTTAKRLAARGLNPGIDVKITDINVTGGGNDQQIKVGDSVEVHGTWDATKATPQPGDEFTIKFPDELKLGANAPIELKDPDGTIWGNCVLVAATNNMTCVLTDAVVGREDEVSGEFFVYTKAVAYTTSETVNFTINNDVVAVPLPGSGGISDGQDIGVSKKSGVQTPDKAAVRWTIDIPGSELAALDAAGTGSLTLSDTLSANMKLCDDGRLNAKLLSGRPDYLKDVADGVAVTQPGAPGSPVGIAITNGARFENDKLYRVEYTSCTTSGVIDVPAAGETVVYDNSVTIGGKTVAADGVGQTWTPETNPKKTGYLTWESRFREGAWSVMLPGTFITQNAGEVKIEDTLGAGHTVCATGLDVKVKRANRVNGPDNSAPASTDVTDQFNIVKTGDSANSTSFTVTITAKDVATIRADQYYYVEYKSCLTQAGVPSAPEKFSNTATIKGVSYPTEAGAPTFTGAKKGSLNTEAKDVAGESQPAGTTLDWKVEIPGRHLEGLTDSAVIKDKFNGTMTVCEVGNDLKKNLNLKVTARDFIGHENVNPTRDLTAKTTVTRTDDGIDFTLPKEAGDYTREVRYYIEYTLCTTSGGLDPRGTEYNNSITYEGETLTAQSVKQEWGGGGTGQGVTRGSFSLVKAKSAISEKFSNEVEFTVKVEEFAPGKNLAADAPDNSYDIKVKADGTPVSGLYPRGTGWQIRLSEINLPTVDGVYFEQGKFAATAGVTVSDNGTEAVVSIAPKSNVAVTLFNTAKLGSATITKTVIGDGARTGFEAFTIDAEIDRNNGAGKEKRQFTLTDNGHFVLENLPIGATVTFTEVQPLNTDLVTWSAPVITPKTLTIGTDAAANTVSITNEATITQGTFEVSKKLTGTQAFNKDVPASFDVIATWLDADNNPQSKTLTLPSNGAKVPFGEKLPGGTEVTLTEMVPANGNGLAYGVPAYTGNVRINADNAGVVTIGKDLGQVDVTNLIDVNDGTLRIAKQISGEAASAIGDDVEFSVRARWKDGVEYRTADLIVKQGQSTPLGVDLPVGTEVTFTETGRPDVAGVEWGTISWGTSPDGGSWLVTNPGGTATGIVSDDPSEGRLITLTNEALWKFATVEFTKYIVDEDGNPVRDTLDGLPAGTEFEVRIDGIDPALPAGTDLPAVGETVQLNAGNNWSWKSDEVVPRNTVITFSEVDPKALPGIDWARPYYYVTADAGDAEFRNTVKAVAGEEAVVEIHNRPIPTANVDIDKIVTGPKGNQVTKDGSTIIQVTATWTDVDNEARSCVLDVKPGASVTPTAQCDA